MSTSSIKRQIRRFHVVVVQWTSKKRTKSVSSYRAVVLTIKPIVVLKSSLWSSSWLLKLPNDNDDERVGGSAGYDNGGDV